MVRKLPQLVALYGRDNPTTSDHAFRSPQFRGGRYLLGGRRTVPALLPTWSWLRLPVCGESSRSPAVVQAALVRSEVGSRGVRDRARTRDANARHDSLTQYGTARARRPW